MRRGISFILLFALAAGLFAAGTWRLLYGGFAVHGEVLTGERPEAAPGLLAAVQIAQDARFTARYDAAAVTSGRARRMARREPAAGREPPLRLARVRQVSGIYGLLRRVLLPRARGGRRAPP